MDEAFPGGQDLPDLHAFGGPELLGAMVAVKRRELERFRLAVTDWEWREYATHA
jgi:glutamine synthetase